jgi:SAM-dependent methyltransferase
MAIEDARAAYDALAPGYDEFNAANDYELWFSFLLPKLEALGLRHGSLLDVGCGTGRAVEPMLRRGWSYTGCDLSPGMVEQARAKDLGDVRLEVCDMRELPVYGSFELVWALNDPVNYLLDEDDLRAGLAAMSANLAADGLLVFDCNTRRGMDALFGITEEDGGWRWQGFGAEDGGLYTAELEGDGVDAHRHRERYWSAEEIQAAMVDVGLEPVAAMGQRETAAGIAIESDSDEQRDHKIIHVARRG